MTSMTSSVGARLIILEPEDLAHLQRGERAVSPDNKFMVAYCPDMAWLAEQIEAAVTAGVRIDEAMLETFLKDGISREPVLRSIKR